MNNPYDRAAVTAVLKATGPHTAAELAKTLRWSRTRVRKALAALEATHQVTHNHDRTWEKLK